MIISVKDSLKLFSITLISFCAVFVCNLFLNFNIDIGQVESLITSEQVMVFYNAQKSMAEIISAISGGCLLITSAIMLFFYIKQYIDSHRKELGILKAIGYSRIKIAKNFWIFGLSIFLGTALGFALSFIIMPMFYESMTEDGILPHVSLNFNFPLVIYLIVLPTLAFGFLSVFYSYFKLKQPALMLLRDENKVRVKIKKKLHKESKDKPFLKELRRNVLTSKKSLIFFIAFGSFCFASMMQMSMRMNELASPMFAAIIIFIGIILSLVTLILAVTTVVKSNAKSISIMKVFGYSFRDCSRTVLNGYRPIAYAGFIVGTLYQHFLINVMLSFFDNTTEAIPEIEFSIPVFLIVLGAFIVIYEVIIQIYSRVIKKIPIKQLMLE